MPHGGILTLSAKTNQNYVHISITDTGKGMSPETQSQIFEPLFTTKAQGIGLGLAVSKSLIEANGGRITVESKPGEGSSFIFSLSKN